MIRVALVDDNEMGLEGYASTLSRFDDIQVVAAMGFDEAREVSDWRDVDVAVLDGAYESELDQLPGPIVARAVRASSPATTVIVVSNHASDTALRFRLEKAGVKYLCHRSELRTPEQLHALVTNPAGGVPPARPVDEPVNIELVLSDDEVAELRALGIAAIDPNKALEEVADVLVANGLTLDDLRGESRDRQIMTKLHWSRYRLDRFKGALAALLRIQPSDPTKPEASQWDIRRVLSFLTTVEEPRPNVKSRGASPRR